MCLYDYSLPYFIGFNQAKEKNWKVKKGSKSTWIKYASIVVKEEEKNEEKEDKSFAFCKWLQVFNVDCLDDANADDKLSEVLSNKQLKSSAKPEERITTIDELKLRKLAVCSIQQPNDRLWREPSLLHLNDR